MTIPLMVKAKTKDGNNLNTMKKIYRYILAAVAIASAAACAEQIENDSTLGQQETPEGLVPMTISAVSGDVTKTTFADRKVYWEETDAIIVFPMGESFTATIVSEDKAYAEFSGLADAAAENFYAVYPYSAGKSCTAGGDLTVSIPAEQTAVAGGFASGANVSVASFAKGDEAVTFQNVCTLLSFSFETDADAVLTKSVTIKAKNPAGGYWGIAGDVTVSFENGETKVSAGNKESVVVNAPDGGFQKGVTYYVPVAPVGNIDGMELTYHHTDGETTCERTNDTDDTFTRSNLFAMGAVPVAYDDLPQEDFDVPIDFTESWPLYAVKTDKVECLPVESQSDDGSARDKYEVLYEYNNVTHRLPMLIYRGKESRSTGYYSYESGKGLMFTGNNGGGSLCQSNFHLPLVPGRYIDKVVFDFMIPANYVASKNDGVLRIYVGGTNQSAYQYNPPATVTEDMICQKVYELPMGGKGTDFFVDLYNAIQLHSRCGGIYFRKVVITYTKNKPVASN